MSACNQTDQQDTKPQQQTSIQLNAASVEMITEPSFKTLDAWNIYGDVIQTTDGITVTSEDIASQSIMVAPNTDYTLTVTARCSTVKTIVRRQLSWMDTNGELISVELEGFECETESASSSSNFRSPATAQSAIVYATSHEDTPVLIEHISLKKQSP